MSDHSQGRNGDDEHTANHDRPHLGDARHARSRRDGRGYDQGDEMSEHFKPSLPANAVDILDGKAKAADIAESMAIAYWMHGRDTETALYHLNAVHEQFADLAAALGYTIARAPTTYTAVDAAEPAEVEDREAYNLRVHGLREEDLP